MVMTTTDHVNASAAAAAITSPWWLPALHEGSQIAAEALPILGVVWILVQIGAKIFTTAQHKKDNEDE